MDFYKDIVKVYDKLFPLNKMQGDFVSDLFKNLNGISVLDAGCGTGSLAIELGRRGAAVKGFDLDKSMISLAKEKCPQALNVKFYQDNLLNIDSYIDPKVNVVYCFGNTLPHLPTLDDVENVIKKIGTKIEKGGLFAIQIVNYDRILNDNIKSLPTIERDGYKFIRNYNLNKSGKIEFETILTELITDFSSTQMVELLPLTKDWISTKLSEYFSELKWYGAFNKQNWSLESFHSIVVAKK